MIDPKENDIDYKALEGKLDLANVLAALLDSMGGSANIDAEALFSNIQIDRQLILEYNEDNKQFVVRIENIGKDEAREAELENNNG
jgi:hypothetical protein